MNKKDTTMHFRHLIKLLICGGIIVLTTSCGFKGDLYLPEDSGAQNTAQLAP